MSVMHAAINRARSKYEAAARQLIPQYKHNISKLMRTNELTQEQHRAIERRMQWHKAWLDAGIRYRDGNNHD